MFIGQNLRLSVAALKAICECHDVVGIVESAPRAHDPSSQKARRKRVLTSLRQHMRSELLLSVNARRLGCEYMLFSGTNVDELECLLTDLAPDVGCIVSMSQLLPERALDVPRHGFINLHSSLLPKYRGPYPLFWQYYDMDLESGFTVHFVDKGEDTGDIIRQESFALTLGMPIDDVRSVILKKAPKALLKVLDDIDAGRVTREPQAHLSCPRRARRVIPGEPLIEWETWPLERVYHVLAGSLPYGVGLDRVPPVFSRFRWTVTSMERQITRGYPGSLRFDMRGPYLVHSEGRIRLRMSLIRH